LQILLSFDLSLSRTFAFGSLRFLSVGEISMSWRFNAEGARVCLIHVCY